MAEYIKGLTKIELAPLDASYVPGTYTQVGSTAKGSFSFKTAAGTAINIFAEEYTKPVITETDEGPMTIEWDCMDVSADVLASLLGGTIVAASGGAGQIYKAPRKTLDKLFAMRVTTGRGHILRVWQASVFTTFDATVTADNVAHIHIVATLQDPNDETLEPYQIEYPVAA